jgi:hypothetical protein
MHRVLQTVVAEALTVALGANCADLVLWWEKGSAFDTTNDGSTKVPQSASLSPAHVRAIVMALTYLGKSAQCFRQRQSSTPTVAW